MTPSRRSGGGGPLPPTRGCIHAVLACTAVFVLAGCAGSTPGAAAGAAGTADGTAAVTVQLFQFRPPALEVPAGTRVAWMNQDDIEHTVTAGTPERRDARFDTPLRGKGATFAVAFPRAGVYPYFCDRHQSMRGEIRVH